MNRSDDEQEIGRGARGTYPPGGAGTAAVAASSSSPIVAADWPADLQRIEHTFPAPAMASSAAKIAARSDEEEGSPFPSRPLKKQQPGPPPAQLRKPAPQPSPTSTEGGVPPDRRRRRRRRISELRPVAASASSSSAVTLPASSRVAAPPPPSAPAAPPGTPPSATPRVAASRASSGSSTPAAPPATTATEAPPFHGDSLPQVDFYRDPTVLSRLILNQKYDAAMGRLKRHPREARVWVCSKRRSDLSSYAVRQLPIHVACWNLGRTIDRSWRESLNQLITHLVVTFPDACACFDHAHLLPIQYAVQYAAHASTVSMLLMAHPESLHCTTPGDRGRTLSDLNQSSASPYMKQTQQVLGLDVAFWQQSRREANFRLQQQQEQELQQQQQQQQQEEQRTEPPAETSNAPGAAPTADPASRMPPQAMESSDSLPFGARALQPKTPTPPPSDSGPQDSKADLEPVGWEQLEERAVAMEQILTEMNEKNFILHRRIERLAQSKLGLLDQLDRLKKSHLVQETQHLQQQNQKLHREVLNMERRLREAWSSGTAAAAQAPRPATGTAAPTAGSPVGESSTLVGHSPSPPTTSGSSSSKRALRADNLQLLNENHALRLKYDDLNRSYRQQQQQLHRLVQVIRNMQRETASIVGEATAAIPDENNDPSHVSTLSASLLTSEDEASSISDSGGLRQRQHPAYPQRQRTIEIEWHTPPGGGGGKTSGGAPRSRGRSGGSAVAVPAPDHHHEPLQDLSDNLSAVFRHAQELMPSPLTTTAGSSADAANAPAVTGRKAGPSSPLSAVVSPLHRYAPAKAAASPAPAPIDPALGGSFSSLDSDDASHDLVLPALLTDSRDSFQPVARVGVSRSGLAERRRGDAGDDEAILAMAAASSASPGGSEGSI